MKKREGVPKKMPEIGRSPNGQISFNRKGIQAYRYAEAPGVPKKMPRVAASNTVRDLHIGGQATNVGIQRYRQESYTMTDILKAPFPYPGGKSDIAPAVWSRFGIVDNYVEPFVGSAAMLLARPGGAHATETVNDLDGLLINAYRAITFEPEATAEWCDWPVSEADLTSRHLALKAARDDMTARLFGDPLYCDPMLAGWWLWGIASWIGDGWCVSDGPWVSVDGRLVDRRTIGSDEEGVWKTKPAIAASVQMGATERGIQSYRASDARGVPRQMPIVGAGKRGKTGMCGVERTEFDEPSALLSYFARLSDRLRRVRFLCGDWQRACKDSVTVNHGLTAVFLDPPYPSAEHDMRYHGDNDIWHQAAAWALARGDDTRLRIAIAGYHTDEIDAMFPPTWERYRWEARGGYANQKADGRGRANAKREIVYFSPHCIDRATDYGPLFSMEAV